jgi:tyrosyl-tRNA synthetase
MFGKVMSLPDKVMEMYYTLLTDLPVADCQSQIAASPRDAKVGLARHLITWLHDQAAADQAEQEFTRTTHGGVPDEMPQIKLTGPSKLSPLLVQAGMVSSNSEGIRKIKEGAVKLDGEKTMEYQKDFTFEKSVVLQLGNRKFVRLIP